MKIFTMLILASTLTSPSVYAAESDSSAQVIDKKAMSYALCDVMNPSGNEVTQSCHKDADAILNKNFYEIALELCLGPFSASARDVSHCFVDAGEKIDLLGAPYENEFSKKIFDCENKEYLEQATQNEVVACHRKHFEAAKKGFAVASEKMNNNSSAKKVTLKKEFTSPKKTKSAK